jgi:tetratricopeptide (TPR) repeat protein
VVAAKIAVRPHRPLASLAGELRDLGLQALAGVDEATDLRAVFGWSYDSLSAEAARLFRFLSLHPGPDISVASAASLAGASPTRVPVWLTELTRAHLITEHRPGRYVLHDLLRAYAVELVHRHDPELARRDGLHRLLDHLLHTAHAADRLVTPARDPIRVPLARPVVDAYPQPIADEREALRWLAAEHRVLLAALPCAARLGLDRQTWQLVWAMDTFLDIRGYWHDRATAWRAALDAAGRFGDLGVRAYTRRLLASALIGLGQSREARNHLEQAVDLFTRAGDRVGQADAHRTGAVLQSAQGRFDLALRHVQQALALHRAAGHQRGVASALNAAGWYHTLLGQYGEAIAHGQEALELHRTIANKKGEAATYDTLGLAHHRLGQYAEAARSFGCAVALQEEIGEMPAHVGTLTRLGDTLQAMGDIDAARTAWRRALDVLHELGQPDTDGVGGRLAASRPAIR